MDRSKDMLGVKRLWPCPLAVLWLALLFVLLLLLGPITQGPPEPLGFGSNGACDCWVKLKGTNWCFICKQTLV